MTIQFLSRRVKYIHFVFYALVFLLYACFPSISHSVDAWGYAGDVKYGNNLLYPHHLLFVLTDYGISRFLNLIGYYPDAIQLVIVLNAFAGVGSVFLSDRIMNLLEVETARTVEKRK